MEMVHLVAIFKKILCDQYNFSKWKILQKCDIWRKIAKSATICYILQRMGWATRGRLMCEVRLQTSNEGSNRASMWPVFFFPVTFFYARDIPFLRFVTGIFAISRAFF